MTKSTSNKESKESPRVNSIRHLITLVILSIVVVLGVPLFKMTTSIYRADLPVDEIENLTNNIIEKVQFKIPVYLDIPNSLEHFIPSCQQLIDKIIEDMDESLSKHWGIEIRRSVDGVDTSQDYLVKFKYLPSDYEGVNRNTESFYLSPFNKEIELTITDNVVFTNRVDDFVSKVLIENVFQDEIAEMISVFSEDAGSNRTDLIMPYSSRYNAVFSLFVESGRSVQWDIDQALKSLTPILNKISHFTNFSISTQIQYYSKLQKEPEFDEETNSYVLSQSDLPTFVNHGDWNLFSHDTNPTINFLVYFPEANYEGRPLKVENSKTNSFLISRWGGVYIFNKDLPPLIGSDIVITESELWPVIEVFTSQLFSLLGVPKNPKNPDVRIDALTRVAIVKNVRQTLDNFNSLIKLTKSLNEISIPKSTKEYLLASIEKIHDTVNKLQAQSFHESMKLTADALKLSDKAFFEKEMVQQVYFPSEHKLAVFLPLLGPIFSIIIMGSIKTIKEIKADKLKARKVD